jgi:TetR/AcrR family fatty acid metabolism transcriptional regulator
MYFLILLIYANDPWLTFMPNNQTTRESTRDRIINSAKKLFAEQGYQTTTVMDISKGAGLSEVTLYDPSRGREDLPLTIPDLWVSELNRDIEEKLFGIRALLTN